MSTLQTPPTRADSDLPGMQQKLSARLARLASRVRTQIAFDAIVRGLAVVLGLLTLSLVLDFWLELSLGLRVLYWLATLAAGAHFLYHYGLKPLGKKLGPVELAEAVDVAQQHTGNQQLAPRVATVLQLPELFGDDEAWSAQMITDAVGRSYRSLEQTDFSSVLNSKHMMQCVGVLLAALLVPGVVGGVMDRVGENVIGTWAERWLMFADTPYPRNTQIEVIGLEDGKLVIPAGENFTLRTNLVNKDESEIEEARLVVRPGNGKKRTEALAKFDASDFRLDMTPLTETAQATVTAGDQSLTFDIVPAARPRLTGLKLTHKHPGEPADAKPKIIDFNGAEGEVSLLELNEVELVLTANVPIAEARYVLDENRDKDAPRQPPIKRVSANEFSIAWTHEERQRFRIELISEQASLISQPIPISVGLKQDRKPSVRVRSTGVGPRITPNALIPLAEVKASDDLGLVNLSMQIMRERTGEDAGRKDFDPIVLYQNEQALQREVLDKYDLEVDQFEVRPTDVLRITGIATDNRYVGKQTGESTTLTFRIVTHKELFREIIARQQQARATFRQAIEDSKDVHAALLKAKSGVEASAQDRRFRAIRREVWKVSNELGKSAEEMRLNRLGGTKEDGNQAYESMKLQILDPLRDLHSQDMEQQLGAIAAAGNADGPQLIQLASDQQALIDQMNALLSRMDRWDELLDAINQLTEVIDQQEQLRDKLNELIDEQIDDLFDE